MLDIMDKHGKVVAVIMDDGTVVRKVKATDDIDALIKERLEGLEKKGKKK
jgi:hypothetical protein